MPIGDTVEYSATHYLSGEAILAGDRVQCAPWTGVVVFCIGNNSFAEEFDPENWSYLGRGFMIEYIEAGLVFSEWADEDLVLIERKSAVPT
jgi:hypothetical protein